MPPKYAFSAQKFLANGKVGQDQFSQLKSWSAVNFSMLTDEQLILFLFGRDNNVKVAKQAIITFFASKLESPELFLPGDIDRPEFRDHLKIYEFGLLSERTKNGSAVFFGRMKSPVSSQFDFDLLVKIINMIGELSLHKDPPNGSVVVADLRGVPLSYFFKAKFSTLSKGIKQILEGFPYSVKQIHIFNTVSFINKILFIAKPFINPEILNKLHFHSTDLNMNDFFKNCLPKNCVPSDYGGDGPSMEYLSTEIFNELRQTKNLYEDEKEQVQNIASKYTVSQLKNLKF